MNRFTDLIRETYRSKTLGRTLFNWQVATRCGSIQGEVLDIAGGRSASYYRYLPRTGIHVVGTNISKSAGAETLVDMNAPLPFADDSFDAVLLFNALYIADDSLKTLREARRVLKQGGALYIATPFIMGEIPEPHDFVRWTKEGLEREFVSAGFSRIEATRYGGSFSAAANLLHGAFVFNTIRLAVYSLALLFDRMGPAHKAPLGYFSKATK